MVRSRFSTPEMTVDDDPVIEMHESQLDRLRARANLAIPSGIIALLALTLLVIGAWRVERHVGSRQSATEANIGAMAAEIGVLKAQLAARTDPARMNDLVREASAGTADASATARRALSVAQQTEASMTPVVARVAAVEGGLTSVQSKLDGLSQGGTAQHAELAKLSQDVEALRTSQTQELTALNGRIQSQGDRIDYQDKDLGNTKKWTKIVGATAVTSLAIVTAHTLGHGSR